ncbi:hypothetical protein KEM55_004273 [Ascosphaera atra]|nr:hypothetical protein KEM55_004273 [Ascosphaera atra]
MSNAVVFERRNKQIQDALDSGNLKQALQHCEKRLKKGERSHFLQAWKANILLAHPDNAHKQRGYQETLELCRADPPVTDLDALDLLYESLRDGDEYKEASQLVWERAAKAKPQDIDIHLRWFTNAMDAGDWKTAQKAAMSLQFNFKERKFYFWAVFLCYMVAVDPASSDMDRKLFGTLAYRMVSKAASLVPSDPQELAPPRAVKTSEELLLLVKIFETQGRYVEIAETLGSKSTGIESKIAQGDWTFVQERIASLRKAHLWEELLRTTKELLALPEGEDEKPAFDPEERDDWKVWQGLLEATKEQWEQANDDSLSFVDAYIEKRPKSRNAQLCRLELVVAGVKKGKFSSDDLLQQCQKFFDTNCRKLPCFSDLRDIIPNLGLPDIKKFVDYASKPIESNLTVSSNVRLVSVMA